MYIYVYMCMCMCILPTLVPCRTRPQVRPIFARVLSWLHERGVTTYVEPSMMREVLGLACRCARGKEGEGEASGAASKTWQ
jgi:hypothetical protein